MHSFINKKGVRELLSAIREMRLEQLENDITQNKKYLSLLDRQDILTKLLQDSIPENRKIDFIEYSDTHTCILAEAQTYFYEQGFCDCLKLIRIIFSE